VRKTNQLSEQILHLNEEDERSQAPRITKYADPHGQHPSRPDFHGRSHFPSTNSLDVDEMLLCAFAGDEHGGGAPNGTGTSNSPHY